MFRAGRHRGLLHGRPVRTRHVAQRFWRLGAVLRHSPAAQSQRDAGWGVSDRGELRRPRPAGQGRAREIARSGRAKNITADIKVYPGAGHSFANNLPAQPLLRIAGFGYDQAATEDAWSRVFAFFGEHLTVGRHDVGVPTTSEQSACRDRHRCEGVGVARPARRHIVAVVDDECRAASRSRCRAPSRRT